MGTITDGSSDTLDKARAVDELSDYLYDLYAGFFGRTNMTPYEDSHVFLTAALQRLPLHSEHLILDGLPNCM